MKKYLTYFTLARVLSCNSIREFLYSYCKKKKRYLHDIANYKICDKVF